MTTQMPHNEALEAALLCSCIMASNNMYNAVQLTNEDSFYTPKHQTIWQALEDMHNNKEVIEVVALTQHLTATGNLEQAGGMLGIMDLTAGKFSLDVNTYVKQLHELRTRRIALKTAYDMVMMVNSEGNIFEALEKVKDTLVNSLSPTAPNVSSIDDIQLEELRRLEKHKGNFQEVVGVPSGLMNFDYRTGGYDKGCLCIIGGRPGMGKTTFVLNIANNAVNKFGKTGIFFSLEMSKARIARSMMAQSAGKSARDLQKNKVTDQDLKILWSKFDKKATTKGKLYIDDTAGASLTYILSEATKAKKKHDIDFVVIDYLQLIRATAATKVLELEKISNELTILSKNLDIPVIALVQLNRSVETRGGDKRPMLSDIKGSGAIEQDAAIISFLYRPEYYNIDQDADGNSTEGITEIITAKNRHGATGTDLMKLNKSLGVFEELTDTGDTISLDAYDMNMVQMQKYEPEKDKAFFDDLSSDPKDDPILSEALKKLDNDYITEDLPF